MVIQKKFYKISYITYSKTANYYMTTYNIIEKYIPQYNNPIILNCGEIVNLGPEETEEKWKGWIWAKTKDNEGWIPFQIIEFLEDRKTGRILEYYSAKELSVEKNDLIEKIKSLNGWTWAKNTITQDEGWIPDEIIEII